MQPFDAHEIIEVVWAQQGEVWRGPIAPAELCLHLIHDVGKRDRIDRFSQKTSIRCKPGGILLVACSNLDAPASIIFVWRDAMPRVAAVRSDKGIAAVLEAGPSTRRSGSSGGSVCSASQYRQFPLRRNVDRLPRVVPNRVSCGSSSPWPSVITFRAVVSSQRSRGAAKRGHESVGEGGP